MNKPNKQCTGEIHRFKLDKIFIMPNDRCVCSKVSWKECNVSEDSDGVGYDDYENQQRGEIQIVE